MKQKWSVLALDRGKKYIGCAYALNGSSVVFPIGFIINDKTVIDSLKDIITRYRVQRIVIGLPHDTWAKGQIDIFAKLVSRIMNNDMTMEFFDEDYTSVEAGNKIGNFQKNVAEDTLAAMIILERRIALAKEKEEYEALKNADKSNE